MNHSPPLFTFIMAVIDTSLPFQESYLKVATPSSSKWLSEFLLWSVQITRRIIPLLWIAYSKGNNKQLIQEVCPKNVGLLEHICRWDHFWISLHSRTNRQHWQHGLLVWDSHANPALINCCITPCSIMFCLLLSHSGVGDSGKCWCNFLLRRGVGAKKVLSGFCRGWGVILLCGSGVIGYYW